MNCINEHINICINVYVEYIYIHVYTCASKAVLCLKFRHVNEFLSSAFSVHLFPTPITSLMSLWSPFQLFPLERRKTWCPRTIRHPALKRWQAIGAETRFPVFCRLLDFIFIYLSIFSLLKNQPFPDHKAKRWTALSLFRYSRHLPLNICFH